MVTSRSLETLIHLRISKSNCFEMPSLEHEDAKNLFLHHAAYGTQFSNYDDDAKRAIEKCIALCYFHKGDNKVGPYLPFMKDDNKGGHYLPLALKALGVQLGCVGNSPSKWVKALPKVKDFNYLQEEENPVYSILRSSFDCLQPIHQSVFMDLILYSPGYDSPGLMQWLALVYNQDLQVIETRLQHLKRRGLLEDVDMTSQRVYVHDLYREFAKLESQGKLNESVDFEKRRWVYYENTYPTELEMTPFHRCWQNLTRICIEGSYLGRDDIRSLQGIEWGYFSNVVVLKLHELTQLRGEVNLKGLKCLRSLDLYDIVALDSLEGLQDLNNLTYFRWITGSNNYSKPVPTCMGQLPASLKVLELRVRSPGVLLRPDVFARCTNLSMLKLRDCRAENLDFSNCTSLQTVTLEWLELLKTVSGLSAASTSSLQSLTVSCCYGLVGIPGLGDLVGLQHLHLHGNSKFKRLPDLQGLTRLQVLSIWESKIEELPGLGCLRQLRELRWTRTRSLGTSIKLPSLSGLEQLQALDFSGNWALCSLEGVFGDLPALRCLNLFECIPLRRLPDLRRLTSLQELSLIDSGIELGEEDVCMLASLPLLQPVPVGSASTWDKLRLDVVRRKVLKWVLKSHQEWGSRDSWLAWTKWLERDLGMLPIYVAHIKWAKSFGISPSHALPS